MARLSCLKQHSKEMRILWAKKKKNYEKNGVSIYLIGLRTIAMNTEKILGVNR